MTVSVKSVQVATQICAENTAIRKIGVDFIACVDFYQFL